jgi:hypothetical protein
MNRTLMDHTLTNRKLEVRKPMPTGLPQEGSLSVPQI